MADLKTVSTGCWVTLHDGDQREAWRIVEPYEADASLRLISTASPLATAILGRQVGERVTVKTPGGRRVVTILDVAPR